MKRSDLAGGSPLDRDGPAHEPVEKFWLWTGTERLKCSAARELAMIIPQPASMGGLASCARDNALIFGGPHAF